MQPCHLCTQYHTLPYQLIEHLSTPISCLYSATYLSFNSPEYNPYFCAQHPRICLLYWCINACPADAIYTTILLSNNLAYLFLFLLFVDLQILHLLNLPLLLLLLMQPQPLLSLTISIRLIGSQLMCLACSLLLMTTISCVLLIALISCVQIMALLWKTWSGGIRACSLWSTPWSTMHIWLGN